MWPFRRAGKPPRPTVLRRAQALAARGRADEAAALLADHCRDHPDDFLALVNLGATYYAIGKYTPAIEQFEKAIQLKPDSATVWLNLGAARNALGHIDQAIEALMRALEIEPQRRDVHYNLAIAQAKKGRPLAAMAELELELAVHPDHQAARALAAQLRASLLPQEGKQA